MNLGTHRDQRRRALGGALAAAAWLGTGCAIRVRSTGRANRVAPVLDDPGDGVPRIQVEAASAELLAGRAFLVDVRSSSAYGAKHALGALWIPLDDIEPAPAAALARFPAGQRPILYCT